MRRAQTAADHIRIRRMTYDPQCPPGGTDAIDDLQFDRAEPAPIPAPQSPAGATPGLGEPIPATSSPPFPGAPAVTVCAACHEPIADVYFEGNGKVVCPRCRDAVLAAQNVASPATAAFGPYADRSADQKTYCQRHNAVLEVKEPANCPPDRTANDSS